MIHFLRRPIAVLLSLLLALTPIIPAQAAMIDNEQVINQHLQGQTRDSLQQLLQNSLPASNCRHWVSALIL